jgi:hypothetical protein
VTKTTAADEKPAKSKPAPDPDEHIEFDDRDHVVLGDIVLVLYAGKPRPGIVTHVYEHAHDHGRPVLDVYTFSVGHAAVPLSAITFEVSERLARETHDAAEQGVAVAYPRG